MIKKTLLPFLLSGCVLFKICFIYSTALLWNDEKSLLTLEMFRLRSHISRDYHYPQEYKTKFNPSLETPTTS